MRKYLSVLIIITDVAVLWIFWSKYAPELRRPLDVLFVLLIILGIVTAVVARNSFLRSVIVVLVTITSTCFALEMAQKYFNILDIFQTTELRSLNNEDDPYPWAHRNPETYLAALEQARGAIAPELLEIDHTQRNVFPGIDQSRITVNRDNYSGGAHIQECIGRDRVMGPPLGFELIPTSRFRDYIVAEPSQRIIHDQLAVIDECGMRSTRDSGDRATDTYLFMGCSFTFGLFVDGDRTLPHYFSEKLGFTKRVLNLGVAGYGPNQALMDLLTSKRLVLAGVDPMKVKGIFYSLIDDHANRVVMPKVPYAPYYEVSDGKAVYLGPYKEIMEEHGPFVRMLEHSRIYPILKERLFYKVQAKDLSYKWFLTVSLLEEIDKVCHERYGQPLTIVYWDENHAVLNLLKERGLDVILVSDAFGEKWRDDARIKYFLFDYHPSANAYRLLGRHLADLNSE